MRPNYVTAGGRAGDGSPAPAGQPVLLQGVARRDPEGRWVTTSVPVGAWACVRAFLGSRSADPPGCSARDGRRWRRPPPPEPANPGWYPRLAGSAPSHGQVVGFGCADLSFPVSGSAEP